LRLTLLNQSVINKNKRGQGWSFIHLSVGIPGGKPSLGILNPFLNNEHRPLRYHVNEMCFYIQDKWHAKLAVSSICKFCGFINLSKSYLNLKSMFKNVWQLFIYFRVNIWVKSTYNDHRNCKILIAINLNASNSKWRQFPICKPA